MPAKLTYSEIKEDIESSGEYELITQEDDYINTKSKIVVLHKECGNTFETCVKNFKSGNRCPICFGTHKKTTEEFNEELKNRDIRYICIEYLGANYKAKMYDPKCGHYFSMKPNDILNGHGCPFCNGTPKLTLEIIKEKIKDIDPSYELISNTYDGSKSKIKLLHKECGTVFETTYNAFSSIGRRCPYCARRFNSSKEEDSLISYIKSIYSGEIIENYRPNGFSSYEADVYLPELNIAFEYDGIYWHSSKFKSKYFHLDKNKYFKEKGIRLIHIFSDEWEYKNDIIKAKISSILGCNNKNVVYARKCKVDFIGREDKSIFLDRYHIQGNDKASEYLGLYYDNELVAVMTFCKPRVALGNKNSEDGEYELSRFATSKHVVGGFSKLLKHAIELFGIKKIITYADLRFTNIDNNVYLKNGFKLKHISQPNYYYVKNGHRVHRFNYMKQRLKKLFPNIYSDNKTETQITEEAGLYQIYDCGNAVYTLFL